MDWIAMAMSLVAAVLIGRKVNAGWIVSLLSCVVWTAVGIEGEIWAMIPMNIIYSVIAYINYRKWKEEAHETSLS